MIERHTKLLQKAHGGQCRKSGEPYIVHPLWVAIILADLEMDKETIVSGMLHDVVEDTEVSEEDIKRIWREVALLVDGVTKPGKAFLFFRQVGGTGRELKEDVPGNGKGYPGHHHQACRPPSQHADAGVYDAGQAGRRKPKRPWISMRRLPSGSAYQD